MESAFDIIWIVVVIIFGIFKFIKRASVDDSSEEAGDAQETEAQPVQETEPGAPVFAYYYTGEGQKKVDVGKTRQLSGREVTEYEIFSEQERLDKLWCAELERQEAQAMQAREEVYAAAEPVDTPSMEEIMACARSGGEKHIDDEPEEASIWDAEPVSSTRAGDREYQLRQLDRWLEAGLIDKKEYKKRKREL